MRVPYSPGEFKSTWSLAWSWDPETRETTGLFDGVSDLDLQFMESYMLHRQAFLGHPLLVHTMLLEALCQFSVNRRNIHQRTLYELEVRFGVTRGYLHRVQETSAERTQSLEAGAVICNRLRTSLVYYERRLSFLKSLAEQVTVWLKSSDIVPIDPMSPQLSVASQCFMEVADNCRSFVDNQMHLCLSLQKRAQGLNDVVGHAVCIH